MKRSIADYVDLTIAYMESPRGRIAWVNNRDILGLPNSANVFAAIQTATRCRKYEELTAVYEAIGPALNARNCGRVA